MKDLLKEKDSLKNFKKDNLKEILSKKNKIIKKYNLDKDTVELCENLNFFTIWQDQRKIKTLKSIEQFEILLKEVEKRYKVLLKTLKLLMPDELIEKRFLDKKFISIIKQRDDFCLILMHPKVKNHAKAYQGKEAKRLLSKLKKSESKKKVDSITGMCASTGQAIGKVSICMTLNDINNFKEGDILITGMTRPEYLSAMKKSAAIVTNEGGVTCHAAIISRELGIPCVIGTKIATKVLKNGDLVEVKANHGEIRIIERVK